MPPKSAPKLDEADENQSRFVRKLILLSLILAAAVAVSAIAAAVAVSSAMKNKAIVIAATDSGRFIPVVPLDQPYLNDPRVQAYTEECIRATFSHDFRNFRRTMTQAAECYTVPAASLLTRAMEPHLAEIERRRMVMTPVMDRAPVIVRAFVNQRGVFTWELQAQVTVTREGTAERIPPIPYAVTIRASRVPLEESVRGILISHIEFRPV